MRETLRTLFEYKAWANGEALLAMAGLEAEAPTTEIAIRTLNHTLIVDRIFAAHMRGTGHAFTSANAQAAPSLAELSQALRASDRELVDYVPTLSDAQLAERLDFTFTDGLPGRMTRSEMLMHLIVHGGLHRGQIGWIMTLEGVTPPADGLTGYLHSAEASTRRRAPGDIARPAPPRQLAAPPVRETPANGAANRLQALTAQLRAGLAEARLDATVKFDLKGEGVIVLDADTATNDDRPADLTVTISIDDLRAIGRGKLSLMSAVTTRRLRLSDMGTATAMLGQLKTLVARVA